MSVRKQRLSATVDADLLAAAEAAVQAGRADSVSAWVNTTMTRQADLDARLVALSELVESYEAEHGEISPEEVAATRRRASADATVVRGRR